MRVIFVGARRAVRACDAAGGACDGARFFEPPTAAPRMPVNDFAKPLRSTVMVPLLASVARRRIFAQHVVRRIAPPRRLGGLWRFFERAASLAVVASAHHPRGGNMVS